MGSRNFTIKTDYEGKSIWDMPLEIHAIRANSHYGENWGGRIYKTFTHSLTQRSIYLLKLYLSFYYEYLSQCSHEIQEKL